MTDAIKDKKFDPLSTDWIMGKAGQESTVPEKSSDSSDIFGMNTDNLADRPVDRKALLDLANEIYSESLKDSSSLKPNNVKVVIQRIFKAINLEWKPK